METMNPETAAQKTVKTSKASPAESSGLVPNNTLITATPEEGRALAVEMARKIVNLTQPDPGVRDKLREIYSKDAAMLIQVSQVTAVEFATIAAANNYWRMH